MDSPPPARLDGWKEIAGHLRRGIRTAQRWKQLHEMPVHQIVRDGSVYAFRDEIDRWLSSEAGRKARGLPAPSTPGQPPPRPRWLSWAVPGTLAAAALAVITAALALLPRSPGAVEPEPAAARRGAAWRLENERLVVFDAAGRVRFEHQFDFHMEGVSSSQDVHQGIGTPPVQIADLDGDGRSEVLVCAQGAPRERRALYAFEEDGRLRFVHQPSGRVRFGDTEYAEPWIAHRAFVTRGPGARRGLWAVFTHGLWFPTRLQEIAPDGSVRQEYWSNGYVATAAEATWNGRPVLLVGGTNNDFKAASLAIFPRDAVTGRTPAQRADYACRDCPPGEPAGLVLFPSMCMMRAVKGQATVVEAWVEGGTRIRVTVLQRLGTRPEPVHAAVYYTLGPDLSLLAADISAEFGVAHRMLERQGVLDHPFGAADDRDMFPLKRWDGRRFADLAAVPVSH